MAEILEGKPSEMRMKIQPYNTNTKQSSEGKDGTRFVRRAAIPLIRSIPSLWNRCLIASSSFLPEFLAEALVSFLIWSTTLSCHPPKVSTGRVACLVGLPTILPKGNRKSVARGCCTLQTQPVFWGEEGSRL